MNLPIFICCARISKLFCIYSKRVGNDVADCHMWRCYSIERQLSAFSIPWRTRIRHSRGT